MTSTNPLPENPQMHIKKPARREILDYLLLRGMPFYGKQDLINFLNRVWDLSEMPSHDYRYKTAEGDISTHMGFRDWDDDYLLASRLNLLGCDDSLFLRFLEQTLHPLVIDEPDVVAEALSTYNKLLAGSGYRLESRTATSGKKVFYKARTIDKVEPGSDIEVYEVVLSYAGEDRQYVEAVAEFLKGRGVSVFYDRFEEVSLWGKDLTEYLDKVFRGSARFCVMFISQYYAEKAWPTYEKRSAFAKAIENREEYILPGRFDDTQVPGLRPTIVYVDLGVKTPEELGRMVLQKLGRIV